MTWVVCTIAVIILFYALWVYISRDQSGGGD
jgi:cytochrome bd-type quinol oxidase subunit 2